MQAGLDKKIAYDNRSLEGKKQKVLLWMHMQTCTYTYAYMYAYIHMNIQSYVHILRKHNACIRA